MKKSRTPKKKPEEIGQTPLKELPMSLEDWEEFSRGVSFFNNRKFWHAHEAWEQVWARHTEDERLFFQGLIQLAAAYHHLVTKKSFSGMMNNFDKAYAKLTVFQPDYLGITVKPILECIDAGKKEANRLGEDDLEEFSYDLVPKLQFHRPGNPDLLVELKEICNNERFAEGIKLFNKGYFWEAHEAWEEVWREQEEGEAKTFAQVFVQMASGYNFLKTSKMTTALYLFEKAVTNLQTFEHLRSTVNLAVLREDLENTLEQIRESAINSSDGLKLSRKPAIQFTTVDK